ncbi:MAG TPA: 4Fe-4S dicluster domain-containing protein [Planctomycetota bacterium]|jgi:sulfhydrogenase subunit beta (sulfur reductase)
MVSVVLTKEQAGVFLEKLVQQRRVMGPKEKEPGFHVFDWIEDAKELTLDYPTSILPPKKAFFPPKDTLLKFSMGNGAPPSASPVLDDKPFVLLGVHPCDLEGIAQLDWAMSQGHVDPHWKARRDAATIIGVNCLPDKSCFCSSVGTCSPANSYDLFLTKIDAGFFVEVASDKGRQLLEGLAETRAPEPKDFADLQAFWEQKEKRATRKLKTPSYAMPLLLDASVNSNIWKETAEKCYSCGSCTTVCPTCFCFDVWEDLALDLKEGERSRVWDSCQFVDFAKVAGGHNFRSQRVERTRHRWYRKFYYLMARYGRPFCVGCGRCTRACTAGIGLVEVLNQLTEEQEQQPEAAKVTR